MIAAATLGEKMYFLYGLCINWTCLVPLFFFNRMKNDSCKLSMENLTFRNTYEEKLEKKNGKVLSHLKEYKYNVEPKRTEKKGEMTVAGPNQFGFSVHCMKLLSTSRYRNIIYYTSDKTNFKRMNCKINCNGTYVTKRIAS